MNITNDLEEENETPHSLTVLCGREFWNVTSAWEADLPDVGLCLERTVLIWVPCIFLWVFSPFHLLMLRRKGHLYMRWTKLFSVKIVTGCMLVAAGITELAWAFVLSSQGMSLPVNEYLAPVVLLLTYSLHLILVVMGRCHGERSSPLIYFFWLLMVLCGAPQVFTTVQYTIDQDDRLHLLMAVTFLVEYSGAVVLFAANCIADQTSGFPLPSKNKNPMPSSSASFMSKVTFHWVNNVMWKGYRSNLSPEDIWDLPSRMSTVNLDKKWDEAWEKETKKQRNASSKEGSETHIKVSVLRVLMRRFLLPAILASLLYLISETIVFASPRILRALIQFTMSLDEPAWHGYFYALLLLSVMLLNTIIKNVFFFMTHMLCVQIRSSVMTAVYRKALLLSNTSRRETTLGEIVNLMAIDSQRLGDVIIFLNFSFVAPIIIAIAIGELWQILGPSALSGLAVLLIIIPANSVLANKIKALQVSQMKCKDSRIKLITEILNGIKVLKLYAWEGSFAAHVDAIRNSEIKIMKKIAFIQATTSFLFNTTPYFVTLVSFTTFVMVSEENTLNAQNAFVAIALINILNLPLLMLPNTFAHCIQANVSLKRLGKYFNASNIDLDSVKEDKEEGSAVAVYEGQFSWGTLTNEESWKLKDINIQVPKKSLVAVVGSVGAGKSSIISALLGEMEKESGHVIMNGKIAYVSQQAWLQNDSLKENILWGEDFDAIKYEKVIEACALQPDLDMLPGGDMTEVGEKGLNLSGGQKQRISLARAVYSNPDIIILDDPLSAVDAHVGRHIFEKLIGPEGLTKDKTRILITHAVWVLPQMDEIFVVQDGRLVERGTYNKLLSEGGNFAQFLLQHITSHTEKDEEELEVVYGQLEETSVKQALMRQVSLHSSGNDVRRRNSSRRSRTTSTGSSQHQSESICSAFKSTSTLNVEKEEGTAEEMRHILIKEENMEKGKVKLQVYHFYAMSMGFLRALLPILFFISAQGCKAGSNLWLLKHSSPVDTVGNTTIEEFNRSEFLAGYGGFGIGQCLFFFVGALTTWTGTLKAAEKIHHELLHNVLHLPMSFFDTNPSGRIMNRMSKDMDALDSLLPNVINGSMSCFAQVLITMAIVISSTPVVAVVIFPVLVVYYFVQKIYITSARQIKRIESLAKSPIFSFFSESLQGVSTIRAFKKQADFVNVCGEKVDAAAKAYVTNVATNRWLLVRLETLGNLITFAAAIFAVAGRGSIEPGIVGLSITYALEVTFIMNAMIRHACEVEANIVSAERIQEYIKEEQEAPWTTDNTKTSPSKSWPDNGCIKFFKYQSRYRPGLELVLKGITCEVKAGEKVGIVGRTGAGKSSLTLGLFRIVEAAGGSIKIDKVNIAGIGLHELREKLTIIPQDPVIFSGTLRMNLDPFSEYSDAEVWNAIQNAHLEDYVKAQASSFYTTIDEGGSNLSVGQRQLVCLARALLRKSKILVLDEATAAVDLDTDDLIQETIRREFADCTILTIAHRLNNIMDCDRVMVLDKGLIAEFSTPSELLSNKHSIFYGMAEDAGLT
ncbi:multidrug resistance-associated protein 1-like isoform X2 [Palaemon carinicauda]|uniref:multidrug resistance-associated protein 1-like isoform X2 n=1 Tax=Palaemon carinicauda TaxID=392227 RepID=UPI0035B5FAB2